MHEYPAAVWWGMSRSGTDELKVRLPCARRDRRRLDGTKRQEHGKQRGWGYIGVDRAVGRIRSFGQKPPSAPTNGTTQPPALRDEEKRVVLIVGFPPSPWILTLIS